VLKKLGMPVYSYRDNMRNYVNVIEKPFQTENLYAEYEQEERSIMLKARECQYCEHPACTGAEGPDIRGIMRRVTVGNFIGAAKLLEGLMQTSEDEALILSGYQERCIRNVREGKPVEIAEVIKFVRR
jgi:prolycopene isomerase